MKGKIKKLTSLICAAATAAAMTGIIPVHAEESSVNLLTSSSLRKADYNNGTNVTENFKLLTDGDYTNEQTINRGQGTYTYYAVYEVNAAIESISAYYTSTSGNVASVIFYGSNDDNLALLTEPPTIDLGWDGDGGDYSDSSKPEKTDFKRTYKLEFLGNTSKGTATTQDGYSKKTVSVSDTTTYKYLVVLMDGWQNTYVSEIEAQGRKQLDPLTVGQAIWAQDIIDRGGNHQGSNSGANTEALDVGKFNNIDDTLKIFFPDAENGTSAGSLTRINALDNSKSGWNGYVEAKVNADAGKYTVYILGSTNDKNTRYIEVTNNSSNSAGSDSTEGKNKYSDSNDNPLYVFTISGIDFVDGENTLKIQATSGKNAPNFIAMYIEKEEDDEPEPAPQESAMDQVKFSGTFEGNTVSEAEQLNVDGETVTAWKGEITTDSGYTTSGQLKVTAVKGDKLQTKTYDCTQLTDASAVFYVVINTVPDSMSFVIE